MRPDAGSGTLTKPRTSTPATAHDDDDVRAAWALGRGALRLEAPESRQRDVRDGELPEGAAGVVAARVERRGDEPDRGDVEESDQHEKDGRDPGPGAEETSSRAKRVRGSG